MYLIGLHSRAHGGKDTVAAHLVEKHGFVQVAFADAVYRGLCAIFGVHDEQILRSHTYKESSMQWFGGRSPRYLLQTLGTEWGRDMVAKDLWIRIAEREIDRHRATNCRGVVVSDVRFDNEADFIRDAGGRIWLIVRPTKDRVREHVSESGIS